MKAFSIKQPWAILVCTPRKDDPTKGIKDIENRTWRTNYRGKLLIHASAKTAEVEFSTQQTSELFLNEIWVPDVGFKTDLFPTSAIIGEVEIVDCVINYESIWAEQSPYCPITGRPFFMSIGNESGKMVRTYGGPFDSYTIPVPDETFKGEYVRSRYCHDRDQWMGDETVSKLTGIPKDNKPIYNWVLANPILYDKPILNVKGKLSFWEPDIDIVECIGCSGKFNFEEMEQDDASENYCNECWEVLSPILAQEAKENRENEI